MTLADQSQQICDVTIDLPQDAYLEKSMTLADQSQQICDVTIDLPQDAYLETRRSPGNRRRTPIGELLRNLRGDRTLRDLERETGIANAYLSNLELGTKRPGLKSLSRLAEYYEVPLKELLKVAELPHPETGEEFDVSAIDVRRGFDFMLSDPELHQYRTPSEPLPLDVQRYIVQLYEHYTGKRVL